MSNCTRCGGSLGDPFDFSSTTVSACQCNLSGLVNSSAALPSDPCCVVSVADKTGEVDLDINDIDLLGNVFYESATMRADLSAVLPIVYDSGTGSFSHNISGVTAGTYGSDTMVPVFTVDPDGHITNVTNVAISTLIELGDDLEAIAALGGTGILVRTGAGTWALRSLSSVAGRIAITYPDGVTGNPAIDLDTTGVLAGVYGANGITYPIITVDDYGRITSAATGTIPTPTLPDHTHSLGQLSNVDDDVDTGPSIGDYLIWDGSEWTYSNISTITLSTDTVTAAANWYFCTGEGDVDTTEAETVINSIKYLTDSADCKIIAINTALYATWATASAGEATVGANRYQTSLHIATLPDDARPIHNTTIPCAAVIKGTVYYNNIYTVQFADQQVFTNVSVVLCADGEIHLQYSHSGTGADFDMVTLSAVDHFIVHIATTYPSKVIT